MTNFEHDFNRFPELTRAQLTEFYFQSPHKQMLEDFKAKVVKVIDGDTLRIQVPERDFTFPLRFINIAAPELNEDGGVESKNWLENQILNAEIDVILNQDNRVGKWGRLLGKIMYQGMDMGEMSIYAGHSTPWPPENTGKLPKLHKTFKLKL